MKVVSVNAEHTESTHKIAFNLDEEITPEFVRLVSYGSLGISGSGKILVVTIPDDDEEPFDKDAVITLNEKLANAAFSLNEAKKKRQRMLNAISSYTGLPLN